MAKYEKPGKPHKYAIFFTLNWKLYFYLESIFPRFFVTDFATDFVMEMVQYFSKKILKTS